MFFTVTRVTVKILQHFDMEMLPDVFLQQQNKACKYTAVF